MNIKTTFSDHVNDYIIVVGGDGGPDCRAAVEDTVGPGPQLGHVRRGDSFQVLQLIS